MTEVKNLSVKQIKEICDKNLQVRYNHSKFCIYFLTLIREILGPSPRYIACDVTVKTKEIQIIYADRVSVGLNYGANFKWHMPI